MLQSTSPYLSVDFLRALKRVLINAGLPLALLALVVVVVGSQRRAHAQSAGITWSQPFNISGPGEDVATDPFLLADPAGYAHLFWAQRFNQDFGEPDTLMYAQWDGREWSSPIDIFLTSSPLLPGMHYPTAVIDEEGYIHMIWIDQNWPSYALYYSSAHVTEARNAKAWQEPVLLAGDATGTNYSLDLAYESPQTLHVIFARVQQGNNPPEQRAVSYTRSTDGGATWSTPLDIYTVPDFQSGASNTRLLADRGRLFASWSEWDETGNGHAVYFARSLDSGDRWESPIMLSQVKPGEYERDWANLALLGEDHLVAMWEGGFRAYRHAQYSYDAGATWTDPIDTFPGLIGENGYAHFVRDSNEVLHLFVAQRIREGNPSGLEGGLGLWHSVWNGGTSWARPNLAGGQNDMVNPTVAVTGGNRLAAAWYSNLNYEIMVMTGEIQGAPEVTAQPWDQPTPTPTETPLPAATVTPAVAISGDNGGAAEEAPEFDTTPPPGGRATIGRVLLIGLLPTVFLTAAVFLWVLSGQRRSSPL